jgi:[acyl-carrier-protein] S-malonyltransferase
MLAVVFPGQGSQSPGMGKPLFESSVAAKSVFEAVSAAVGRDVADLCFNSDEETLRQTQNAQIALYTVGLAAFAALREAAPDLPVKATAGHSVGEYAALAAAGVLDVAEGARLVHARGETMAQAPSGTMAAVLGLERGAVEEVLQAARGVVVVANDNCPGQLVISGEVAVVAEVSDALKEKGAKRVLPLNVSGAFHSPLMDDSAKTMAGHLAGATFHTSEVKVYSNVRNNCGRRYAGPRACNTWSSTGSTRSSSADTEAS